MIFSGSHPVKSRYAFLRQVANGLVAVLLFTLPAYSQKTDSCFAGVFITQDDFINNHLSYKINTDVKDHKLSFTFPADLHLR
jgi:hypothetical protein